MNYLSFVMTSMIALLSGQLQYARAQPTGDVFVALGSVALTTSVVNMEVRFIEVPRDQVDRLVPVHTYVVGNEMLQKIQALVDKKQAAILSQPRIVTESKLQAQVKSVRELIYPSEYDSGSVRSDNNQGTNITVQITQNATGSLLYPSAFKTREVGTIFNVTPTVGDDGSTIDLALTPEMSLLSKLGFVKHEMATPVGKVEVSQPDFFSWDVSTSIVMKSGTTVLVATLEPNPTDQPANKDTVVLVLVTATVNHIE